VTSSRLRIVFFGTGGVLSAACLRAVAQDHDVAGIVRAARGGPLRRLAGQMMQQLGRRADPLTQAARSLGMPQWRITSGRDPRLPDRVRQARPDVICVAHFPWRLPDDLLALGARGGINVHPSLLPRHRGVLPLFWVYHANDRDTGITVHEMRSVVDTGDILSQQSFALPRGYPVDELNARNAQVAAPLLAETLVAIAQGREVARPQDDRQATLAPGIPRGKAMVDFDTWDVERVWHFLAGVWPRFLEPLAGEAGGVIRYAGIEGFERREPTGQRGQARRAADGRLTLNCRDGVVWLRASE
jgi:methionyl-tRNA formyltransferase